jgi:hypothetical protein
MVVIDLRKGSVQLSIRQRERAPPLTISGQPRPDRHLAARQRDLRPIQQKRKNGATDSYPGDYPGMAQDPTL